MATTSARAGPLRSTRRRKDLIAMLPKDALTKTMIRQAIDALNAVSKSLEQLKAEMRTLAAKLPEYSVVMAMRGVGDSLGPQLMAEIGDVTRFTHRDAITAFAGVDPVLTSPAPTRPKSNKDVQKRAAGATPRPVSGHGLPAENTAERRPGVPFHGQETLRR